MSLQLYRHGARTALQNTRGPDLLLCGAALVQNSCDKQQVRRTSRRRHSDYGEDQPERPRFCAASHLDVSSNHIIASIRLFGLWRAVAASLRRCRSAHLAIQRRVRCCDIDTMRTYLCKTQLCSNVRIASCGKLGSKLARSLVSTGVSLLIQDQLGRATRGRRNRAASRC